jgi:UDP-glucose 4-epimerase
MVYKGSYSYVILLNAGYDIFVVDNLSNSNQTLLERVDKRDGLMNQEIQRGDNPAKYLTEEKDLFIVTTYEWKRNEVY